MPFFLGIDGGQSSTVALIADETGKVLGSGNGGPCNHVAAADARAKFHRAISEAISGACGAAKLDSNSIEFEVACFGFSGGAADKDVYCREYVRSRSYKITHDADIALLGATAGKPGIIVIAGTGSIAFGKNAAGKMARAGGWGYIFGDEGGAFDTGRRALRAALAMEEGWGPNTLLREALLQNSGATSVNELLHQIYSNFEKGRIARWAMLVDEAAKADDRLSVEILQAQGRELATLAHKISSILFAGEHQTPIVSYVGGVFQSEPVRGMFHLAIRELMGIVPTPPCLAPAAGAVIEALQMSGRNVPLWNAPLIKT